jgi:uncharacterized protein YggE
MVQIMVSGQAVRKVAPEQGVASVSVSATGDARSVVLAEALAAHDAVVAAAQRAVDSGAAASYTSPAVAAWAYKEWVPVPDDEGGQAGQHKQVTRFRAGADVQVTFTDFESLGEFLLRVGSDELVNIGGIQWRLTDEAQRAVERELRAEAAHDAVARAGDYAVAMALPLPVLTQLSEGGLANIGAPEAPMAGRLMKTAAFAEAAMDQGGGFDLRPSEIELTASVSAVFATTDAA